MVEYVSYDGEWPNLCSGSLVIKVNGEEYALPRYILKSGGQVSFDKDWSANVTEGSWSINDRSLPDELKPYWYEIQEIANYNIPWGCCGGCV